MTGNLDREEPDNEREVRDVRDARPNYKFDYF